MRQGLAHLRRNKGASAACAALVLILTGLGVWTNDTAERQGDIERIVRVQNSEVVQALCNRPFTSACLRRAINIVRTCLANERCTELLSPVSGLPGVSRPPQPELEFRAEKPKTYETRNSSQGIGRGGEESGPGAGSGGGRDDGKKAPPPVPGPTGPLAPPAPDEPAVVEPGSEGPGRGNAGGNGGGQGQEKAQTLVPSAVRSVEGVTGCVGKADLGCSLQEVGVPDLGAR